MGGNKATPQSLALGAALREARLTAGYDNLTKFAAQIGRTAATLSRWETGQRTPRPEDAAQILTILGVTGDDFEDLLALTRTPGATSWLAVAAKEQRRHVDALLHFERDAEAITTVAPLIVPGVLQTREYVRAIMTAGGVPHEEIEPRIAIRLGRRDILHDTELTAYIGQAALVQQVGGRDVLRGQLEHLLEMSEQIDLRVIPFTAGYHPALAGPWYLLQSAQGTTVVYLENRLSGLFLHEQAHVAEYRSASALVRGIALSPDESRRIMADEVKNLQK